MVTLLKVIDLLIRHMISSQVDSGRPYNRLANNSSLTFL